jgi:predicted GTPase
VQQLREAFDCHEVPIRVSWKRRDKVVLGGED